MSKQLSRLGSVATLLLFIFAGVWAQQPQTQLAPIYAVNAKYVNGVAPGYWSTAGSGLTLNISAGTSNCASTIATYAGGTLTMTNNTTNYVYLDATSSCVPASNTSGFTGTTIPIAKVVTSGGAISTITDVRTALYTPTTGTPGSGTVTSIATSSPISGGTITTSGTLSCPTCVVASSPGAGIAHFAGGTQTVTSSAVVGSDMANNTVTATQLAAQYAKLRCETGLGDGLNAMPAGTYLQSMCYNDSGVTWTITGIKCFTDNSGTSTLNASGNTLGALLTGAFNCSSSWAAGTQSANVALTSGDYIKFTFVADGTSKQTTWLVSFTQ